MRVVEVTLEKRMCLVFEASDEEVKALEEGYLPDRIEKAFDDADWKEAAQDYAVWDCVKHKQLVDWQ